MTFEFELVHLLFALVPPVAWLWRRVHSLEMEVVRQKTKLEHGSSQFAEVMKKLDSIDQRIRHLEQQFAAVAPALAREAE